MDRLKLTHWSWQKHADGLAWLTFDKQGESIGGNGPPSLVFSTSEERFDPLDYVDPP